MIPALLMSIVPIVAAARIAASDPKEDFERLLGTLEANVTEKALLERAASLARLPDAPASYLDVRVAERAFTPGQLRLLDRASALLDRGAVVTCIERRAREEPDATWRCAAFELLEAHASAGELSLMIRLLGPLAEDSAEVALLDAFQSALAAVIRREPRVLGDLPRSDMDSELLRRAVIRAVGRSGEVQGFEWLADQLDPSELAAPIVQELGRLASAARPEVGSGLAATVRPLLRSEDLALRKHAMHLLAELGDETAIPALIRALGAESGGESRAALDALRQLSGCELAADAEAWTRWHGLELQWLRDEAGRTLERLNAETEADRISAVRELSGRSLHREDFARLLSRRMEQEDSPAVRAQICLALSRLASKESVEVLVRALEDPDPGVRDHAWKGLRSMTGLDLPQSARAWSAATESRAR